MAENGNLIGLKFFLETGYAQSTGWDFHLTLSLFHAVMISQSFAKAIICLPATVFTVHKMRLFHQRIKNNFSIITGGESAAEEE